MIAIRKLPAIFYCSANGHEPVRKWLKSMNQLDRKIIGEDIAYVQYTWICEENTANAPIRTGLSHQAMEGMDA